MITLLGVLRMKNWTEEFDLAKHEILENKFSNSNNEFLEIFFAKNSCMNKFFEKTVTFYFDDPQIQKTLKKEC